MKREKFWSKSYTVRRSDAQYETVERWNLRFKTNSLLVQWIRPLHSITPSSSFFVIIPRKMLSYFKPTTRSPAILIDERPTHSMAQYRHLALHLESGSSKVLVSCPVLPGSSCSFRRAWIVIVSELAGIVAAYEAFGALPCRPQRACPFG